MGNQYYAPSSHRTKQKFRNINLMAIEFGFRHSLRTD